MTEPPITFRSFRRCSQYSARWMEMSEPFWKTAISRVEPNKIVVRGYNLVDLVGKYSYADLTYLLWRGELPSAEHSRMMDALLTVCLEHSLNAPSVDATRFVASSGGYPSKQRFPRVSRRLVIGTAAPWSRLRRCSKTGSHE